MYVRERERERERGRENNREGDFLLKQKNECCNQFLGTGGEDDIPGAGARGINVSFLKLKL